MIEITVKGDSTENSIVDTVHHCENFIILGSTPNGDNENSHTQIIQIHGSAIKLVPVINRLIRDNEPIKKGLFYIAMENMEEVLKSRIGFKPPDDSPAERSSETDAEKQEKDAMVSATQKGEDGQEG